MLPDLNSRDFVGVNPSLFSQLWMFSFILLIDLGRNDAFVWSLCTRSKSGSCRLRLKDETKHWESYFQPSQQRLCGAAVTLTATQAPNTSLNDPFLSMLRLKK